MIEWIKKAATKNISGNYKFHIKSEPENVDIGSVISVTAFTDKSESAMLPCHYKWFRIRNGLTEECHKFRGNSYVCDSSDLGSVIQVLVIVFHPLFRVTTMSSQGKLVYNSVLSNFLQR